MSVLRARTDASIDDLLRESRHAKLRAKRTLSAWLEERTLFTTIVNMVVELPLFFSWRCHARRLQWPFSVITPNPDVHVLLQQAIDPHRGESTHLISPVGVRGGNVRMLRAFLQALPHGARVLFVQVDVVLLQPLCKAVPHGITADLMFWPVSMTNGTLYRSMPLASKREYLLRSLMVGGTSVLFLRKNNIIQEMLAEAAFSSHASKLGLGPVADEGRAFSDAIRWRHEAGIVCLGLSKHGEAPACPLVARPLDGLGVVTSFQYTGPLRDEAGRLPYVVPYGIIASSLRGKIRAMWQRGHWALYGAPFAEFFGVWDIHYSNGLRLLYNISPVGEVHAVGHTDGLATGWLREQDAGRFTHHLEGVFKTGKWERLRLSSGRVELQHWIGTDMICTAYGERRSTLPRKARTRIPVCGCPLGTVWSQSQTACASRHSHGVSPSFRQMPKPRLFANRRLVWGMAQVLRLQQHCDRPVISIRLGAGGGFASKFQMAAAQAASALRRGMRFQLVGHFAWYTNNSGCLQHLGPERFLRTGYECHFTPGLLARKSCSSRSSKLAFSRHIPSLAVVQATLLRPNTHLQQFYKQFAKQVGYDATQPLVALHIRRGDKTTNVYNQHHPGDAYVKEAVHAASQLQVCHTSGRVCQLYVASDSAEAFLEVQQSVNALGVSNLLRVLGLLNSATQGKSAVGVELSKDTMLNGFDAYSLAVEILFDIEMLSRAQILVGTLASQVTRVAAVVGIVYGTLLRAVALDFHLLAQMQDLFSQWGIRVDDVPWQAPQMLRWV